MRTLFCFLLLLCSYAAFSQEKSSGAPVPKRTYTTQRIAAGTALSLDGIPDEEAWSAVAWSEEFIQHEPTENTAPYQQTRFKVLYDSRYLYLTYEAFDSAPDSITRRMSRRDEFVGDWVEVNIDSHHDLRTGYSFTISASGVRGDEAISDNGNNWDANWNPIWYAKTHIGTQGWTAEIKIPFSQLRYGSEADKVWGLQVQRRLFRKEERSFWQFIPQSSGVWVSGFGELRGLHDVPSQKQVEIAPYVVAQTAQYKRDEGNPFATGSSSKISGGLDGKLAVTSDLMLDFTVNPDFGQVEADPSQVRIDGFQSFFEERRPFFIEGRNIFDYRLTGSSAGGDYDQDLLFYSRRIGSAPHGYPVLGAGEYADVPERTNIPAAAKFSGKTGKGWSIGILESVTKAEYATVDHAGERRDAMVEPLTNYFVGRLQKDVHGGNTVLGGIFTAVSRDNDLDGLLHKAAYSGGLDFLHYWKQRNWYYTGKLILSRVEGVTSAISNTQTSFEHLFNRIGIREASFDSTRTSLTGTSGTFKIGKSGGRNGKWGQTFRMETGITWRSPQLELNDIGFMLTADEINHFAWASMIFQRPISIFRNARINYNHWSRWDFAGQWLYLAFNANAFATFRNYWSARVSGDWNPYEVSNNALRGASALRKPSGGGLGGSINSDSRRKVTAYFNFNYGFAERDEVSYIGYDLGLNAQPVNALSLGLALGYSKFDRKGDQFVAQTEYNGQPRIIVGSVSQETVRLTLRANYNITPDITIQYYGQPFITRPVYGNYGYIVDPLNAEYDTRFHRWTGELKDATDHYDVDENGDGKSDYSFSRPDFNFVQFRSNLVLRWEYRSGSEFYLVWSEGTTPNVATDLSSPLQRSLFENMFADGSRNTFLLKATYRFLK